ncbi:hypothetical protein ES703_61233 [subsurface metagenome]
MKTEIEEIGVGTRLRMRGLKNRGMMEISEDPKSGDFVLVISKGIREKWYRKWLRINLPQGMWRVKCSKEEVSEAVNKFLSEKILT